MKNRTVKKVLYAHPFDMGGLPIRQPFPTAQVEQIDPFILLHHARVKVPKHTAPRHAGVGPHPHCGFSPVTFIFKGAVHHRDSRGNNQVVHAGGVQWMNAGMGIIHSERPSDDIHEIGGEQEIIQLWVNTAARHKMDQPVYYPREATEIPTVLSSDGLVKAAIVAGDLLGIHGSVPTQSPVNAATLAFEKDGVIEIVLPATHNSFIYLLDGKLRIKGHGIVEGLHAVWFDDEGEGITLQALEPTRVLLMTGEPLKEKVVSHGPFVMNSETQILEAMRDYQMGKMGVLIED